MPDNFKKLQNIYRMFSPGAEIAERSIKPVDADSILQKLQNILINTSEGVKTVSDLKASLENLYKGAGISDGQKKELNRYFTFYSSLGRLEGGPQSAYMWTSEGHANSGTDVDFHRIIGLPGEDPRMSEKPTSIILSRTPFVSPATRDASFVESFLNFMPSVVMSRCVPYLDVEFVFDRPAGGDDFLTTASQLKFLLGGKNIKDLGTTDKATYEGSRRKFTPKQPEGVEPLDPVITRNYTATGMEMFTSPQTLLNLESDSNSSRYIKVLNPMLPFATIESASINVKGTTGIMCHKTAQLVLMLHDRSRLTDIADIIQPAAYGRTTIWLTYGWRSPSDPNESGTDGYVETYAEFINNKMLIKEAYGIVNSQFTFDTGGQVKITLSLFTKSASEMRQVTLAEDQPFLQLIRDQEKLSRQIREIKQKYNIEQPEGINKEIRAFTIINGAANGNSMPDMNEDEVRGAIDNLFNSIGKGSKIPPEEVGKLRSKLNKFYFGEDPGRKKFNFKAKSKENAVAFIQSKFEELNGPDPFLVFKQVGQIKKMEKMMSDFGIDNGEYPYISELESSAKSSVAASNKETQKLIAGTGKTGSLRSKVVSFGKLFSVFVVPSVYTMDFVDECQVFFYNINDYAGLASGTNIAEFAIDLPEFLRQYEEQIAANATVNMTVEQFVQLAVNSQITDLRAIPFGFRSHQKELFKEWKPDSPNAEIADKKESQFAARSLAVNASRGGFQLPNIEVIIEMTRSGLPQDAAGDLLRMYSGTGLDYGQIKDSNQKRIMKIHVFDKGQNPYSAAARILADEKGNGVNFSSNYDVFDPFKKPLPPVVNEKGETVEMTTQQKEIAGLVKKTYMLNVNGSAEDRDNIRRNVSRLVPTLVPGMNNSSITEASVSTQNDPQMATIQIMGANRSKSPTSQPRGDGMPGLPLRIIPVTMSMKSFGCPLINFAQMFFVDMNTGTTIDNIYGIIGITHSINPGKFETSLELTPVDAYGKYEAALNLLDEMKNTADKAEDDKPKVSHQRKTSVGAAVTAVALNAAVEGFRSALELLSPGDAAPPPQP